MGDSARPAWLGHLRDHVCLWSKRHADLVCGDMNSTDGLTWTGDLYATTGPFFATVPFNPANVVATKVGTMTWTAQTVDTGNVFYTVNGVAVSKNVVRQTLVFDDFSGHYAGGSDEDVTACLDPAFNGTIEGTGNLYVVQNGQAITFQTV